MNLRRFFRLPYILIVLAVLGPVFLLPKVMRSTQLGPPPPVAAPPAAAPYASYIAGTGTVESSTRNLNIVAPVTGIVAEMRVEPGQKVRKGQLLFRIDSREAQAELLRRQAAVEVARSNVAAAEASTAEALDQFQRVRDIADPRVVSVEERRHRELVAQAAEKRLESARADLRAAGESARAQAITVSRLDVLSPIDGEVLQVNVRAGELASTLAGVRVPLVLGNTETLHVRVEIDENIAWRFVPGSQARGFLRGNKALETDLQFVRLEPLLVGKTSLTGSSTERVDTRVLQVIYAFDQSKLRAYPGMLLDVFIETPAEKAAGGAGASSAVPAAGGGGAAPTTPAPQAQNAPRTEARKAPLNEARKAP
ncbi:MAG: biotin/lipoyl-binding protein [Rhodocyclaceae bacterium]|nr:biotin/lipoyl-binding protein [Rhodocyclaceae bacterium]